MVSLLKRLVPFNFRKTSEWSKLNKFKHGQTTISSTLLMWRISTLSSWTGHCMEGHLKLCLQSLLSPFKLFLDNYFVCKINTNSSYLLRYLSAFKIPFVLELTGLVFLFVNKSIDSCLVGVRGLVTGFMGDVWVSLLWEVKLLFFWGTGVFLADFLGFGVFFWVGFEFRGFTELFDMIFFRFKGT